MSESDIERRLRVLEEHDIDHGKRIVRMSERYDSMRENYNALLARTAAPNTQLYELLVENLLDGLEQASSGVWYVNPKHVRELAKLAKLDWRLEPEDGT